MDSSLTAIVPRDADRIKYRQAHWHVTALTGTDQHGQWLTVAVDGMVDLGAQPTSGAADRMVSWLDKEIHVIQRCSPRGSPQGGGVLVSSVDRGVDAHSPVDIAIRIRLGQQCGEDVVLGAVRTELLVPGSHRLPLPEPLGQATPGDSAPVPVDDPLHHLPMIPKRSQPAHHLRHNVSDPRPLAVSQFPFTAHTWSIAADTCSTCETRPGRPTCRSKRRQSALDAPSSLD